VLNPSSVSGTDSVPLFRVSSTLKMGTESVPETLEEFYTLKRLVA
jgi:hypothetical protein